MNVRWTEDAAEDLRGIFQYIASDNVDAARNVCSKIVDNIDSLSGFPRKGRPGRVGGTRELVISGLPYIVVYEVADHALLVLKIVHGALRWP